LSNAANRAERELRIDFAFEFSDVGLMGDLARASSWVMGKA
jgi:hypothetical protein